MGFSNHKTYTSSNPNHAGYSWVLEDRAHDWTSPVIQVFNGKAGYSVLLKEKPSYWPDGIEWISELSSIEDVIKTLEIIKIHDVKQAHLPSDVSSAMLDEAYKIQADLIKRQSDLREVIMKMRAQLAGYTVPQILHHWLSPPYEPDVVTRVCQAVRVVSDEVIQIQYEVDRLASLPHLKDAVAEALNGLKDLNVISPGSQHLDDVKLILDVSQRAGVALDGKTNRYKRKI